MIDSLVIDELAPDGVLRVAINLGNPVLAQGTSDDPRGVTVDIARALAERLDVRVEFRCSQAARHSFEAVTDGSVAVAFLAVEPARAEQVAFSAPYVLIEGVHVVPAGSPLETIDDVDRSGVRIGVNLGSAYDLFLTRTLQHAEIVRGDEGTDVFVDQGLDVGAGIRQPVERFAAEHDGYRLLPGRFMQIAQTVAVRRDATVAARAFVHDTVEELKRSGAIAGWLVASGQPDAQVAPAHAS